jgi:neurotransmitter:Na+ symporter, NSS family
MMSEFIIGRHSASNAARAYSNLGKHKAWGALGLMGVITSMIILGFYAVVAGWCLQYLYASIMGGVHGDAEYVKTYFQTFSADPIRPTLWACCFSDGMVSLEPTMKIIVVLTTSRVRITSNARRSW